VFALSVELCIRFFDLEEVSEKLKKGRISKFERNAWDEKIGEGEEKISNCLIVGIIIEEVSLI
jgi:hypothetical protein